MLHLALVVALIGCAIQAMRAPRLLTAALWLAGASALLALLLSALGAHTVAVIELSVGAGLVTVLFVFAIGSSDADAPGMYAILPQPLAWGLVILASGLLGWMALPWLGISIPPAEAALGTALWQERGLDVLVQMVLLFAGALGVVSILAETDRPLVPRTGRPRLQTVRRVERLPEEAEVEA